MFGSLGVPELIFIFGLALLIFGPKQLPQIGRTLGKGMAEFRKASNDLRRTINAELIEEELKKNDPRQAVKDTLKEYKESLEQAIADAGSDDRASGSGSPPAATSPEASGGALDDDGGADDGGADAGGADAGGADAVDSPVGAVARGTVARGAVARGTVAADSEDDAGTEADADVDEPERTKEP